MGKGNAFVKRLQRLDLRENSFVILHCDPSLSHKEVDGLLAKIKGLVGNRFPGLMWIALPAGKVLDVQVLGEGELKKMGWVRSESVKSSKK